jgi:hypothetical protein
MNFVDFYNQEAKKFQEEQDSLWANTSKEDQQKQCGRVFRKVILRGREIVQPVRCNQHECPKCHARKIQEIIEANGKNAVSENGKRRKKKLKRGKEAESFKRKIRRNGGKYSEASGENEDEVEITSDLPEENDDERFGEEIDCDDIDWEKLYDRTHEKGEKLTGSLTRRKGAGSKKEGELIEAKTVIVKIRDRDQVDELFEEALADESTLEQVSNATEYEQAVNKLYSVFILLLEQAGVKHWKSYSKIIIDEDDIENHNRDVRVRIKLSKVNMIPEQTDSLLYDHDPVPIYEPYQDPIVN